MILGVGGPGNFIKAPEPDFARGRASIVLGTDVFFIQMVYQVEGFHNAR